MDKNIVAIVQARMGSKRFPGKMLANLGGIPILEWVIRRVGNAKSVNRLVISTTKLEKDNYIVDLSKKFGIKYYRGSEDNVLKRFSNTSLAFEADWIIRICADNPFVDPVEIDRLVNYFNEKKCDYACNHMNKFGNNYADGFGAEIFSSDLLYKMNQFVTDQDEQEHITSHLYNNPNKYKLSSVKAPPSLSYPNYRFDVDEVEDLKKLEKLCNKGVNFKTPAVKIMSLALEMA